MYERPLFCASLMCMDYLNMRQQFDVLNERVDMYHVDIMDGHFAKNLALSPDFVKYCSKIARRPIDAHLMVDNPGDYVDSLARAGASFISPHAETINHEAFRLIDHVQSVGCKFGVALNPATPLSYIAHYLNHVSILTIMTVDVGFSGSRFIPEMLDKVREAVDFRASHGLNYIIQVDGACNKDHFAEMDAAGADAYAVGNTGLFGLDPDLERAFDMMVEDFETAVDRRIGDRAQRPLT